MKIALAPYMLLHVEYAAEIVASSPVVYEAIKSISLSRHTFATVAHYPLITFHKHYGQYTNIPPTNSPSTQLTTVNNTSTNHTYTPHHCRHPTKFIAPNAYNYE